MGAGAGGGGLFELGNQCLHLAWRERLPGFSLTTVQSRLLGRRPTRSASPAELSRAHLALAATGHAEPIKPVLARNRDDLLSMAELLCLLLTGTDPAAAPE